MKERLARLMGMMLPLVIEEMKAFEMIKILQNLPPEQEIMAESMDEQLSPDCRLFTIEIQEGLEESPVPFTFWVKSIE